MPKDVGNFSVGTLKEIASNNTVTDYTCNGECSRCGGCCSDFLPLTRKEQITIGRYIKAHNIKEQSNLLLNPASFDITCPFLSSENRRCLIYEVRPKICRTFICSQDMETIQRNKRQAHQIGEVVCMREYFYGKENPLCKILGERSRMLEQHSSI